MSKADNGGIMYPKHNGGITFPPFHPRFHKVITAIGDTYARADRTNFLLSGPEITLNFISNPILSEQKPCGVSATLFDGLNEDFGFVSSFG